MSGFHTVKGPIEREREREIQEYRYATFVLFGSFSTYLTFVTNPWVPTAQIHHGPWFVYLEPY